MNTTQATLQRLILVLPGQGLDDFPGAISEPLAADFLASWSVLWHPKLLSTANALPEWKRADGASLEVHNALILAPKVSESKLGATITERFSINGCLYAKSGESRSDTLNKIAVLLGIPVESVGIDEKAMELFALGYAYFQLQLLTRRLRYSSNVEQPVFAEQVLEAAKAALAMDEVEFERWLQAAYDFLAQDRDRYYSQSAYLLDITLLAETTLGNSLRRQLQRGDHTDFLASSQLLKLLRDRNRELFETMLEGVQQKRQGLFGGCDTDHPLALQTETAFQRCLERADAEYLQLGFPLPDVFASLGSLLPYDSPRTLRNHGYDACVLHGWTVGAYPEGRQSKITWEGTDGSTVDALAKNILDANLPSSFLALGSRLGEQLDYHQIPTLVFAHWPGCQHEWFEIFKRVVRRTPFLGTWKPISEYFKTTQRPYYQDRLAEADFVTGLRLDQNDLVQSVARYYELSIRAEIAATVENLVRLLRPSDALRSKNDAVTTSESLRSSAACMPCDSTDSSEVPLHHLIAPDCAALSTNLDAAMDGILPRAGADSNRTGVLSKTLDALADACDQGIATWTGRLRDAITRTPGPSVGQGYFVFNPYAGPMRCFLEDLQGEYPPAEDNRIYASHFDGDHSKVIVDVPPMGFVRLAAAPRGATSARSRGASIAVGPQALANEFMEVHFHAERGYLRGLYLPGLRGNFCSGMITFGGLADPSPLALATTSMETLESNPVVGRIRIRGDLSIHRARAGTWELTYTLWRGSRILEIQGSLRDVELAGAKYLAWRWAWPSFSSIFSTWRGQVKGNFGPLGGFAPLGIEVDESDARFLLLSSGTVVHRKVPDRFLDTVLSFENTRQCHFRLGIGVNSPRPYQSCLEWVSPGVCIDDPGISRAAGESAWLVQSNLPNTHVAILRTIQDAENATIGMRLLVRETAGQSGTVTIRTYRNIDSARRVGGRSQILGILATEGDSVSMTLRSNETAMIDLIWKRDS